MTDKVVNLNAEREARQPHKQGAVVCLDCKHEWHAVCPSTVYWMECPNCGLHRGKFKFAFMHQDNAHWFCKCGNDLFYVRESGYFCPNCGEMQKGF